MHMVVYSEVLQLPQAFMLSLDAPAACAPIPVPLKSSLCPYNRSVHTVRSNYLHLIAMQNNYK